MDECKVLCYIYSQHTDLFRLVAAAGAEVTVMRPMSRPQMLDLDKFIIFYLLFGGNRQQLLGIALKHKK